MRLEKQDDNRRWPRRWHENLEKGQDRPNRTGPPAPINKRRPVYRLNAGLCQLDTLTVFKQTPSRNEGSYEGIRSLVGEMTRQTLQRALGLKDDEHFRKAYLLPALETGLIEMTIPDKPNSRLQKYRLTARGADVLRPRERA